MDRNTVFGLVIIGLILSVFTIYNQPSDEEIQAEKEKIELAEKEAAEAEKEKLAKESQHVVDEVNTTIPKLDNNGEQILTDNGDKVFVDTLTNEEVIVPSITIDETKPEPTEVKGELIRMENEKLIIDFSTKGGQIAAVRMKEFESYANYAKKDDKIDPLVFFKNGDASNGIVLPMDGADLNTADELFTVKSKTDDKIVFELKKEGKQAIEFAYTLKTNAYDLDHDITVRGFAGKVTPKNVMFNWDASLRKTERLFSEQRRVSTVCFKYEDEGFDWLNEMTDGEQIAEDKIDWFSFKQSYFSSFIRPQNGFGKEGSKFEIDTYEEGEAKDWTHLKDFSTTANLNLTNVDNGTVSMNWFFGPNDYKLLTSFDDGYDDVLNYGWGLFRWINLYAVQPMFNVLKSTGMGMGIAILLLTLIIKFALMPIQWKMYTSSAKMRILKPEIESINERYPDKADSMKKQMETMTLYRESGASPLAGCVPMLIQMPILLAVFRFFPSTFDLRQKSFLWAEDLSSYDSIASIPSIPFYGDHISLFTLLMAITTLVYTHINSGQMQQPSQPGMPNMKVIMYFFPVMMIFFFNNYASGLSYYYFISTLTSILIMVLIKKFFVDEEKLKLKMANRKATAAANPKKGKGKSKFQERLEQMQKAQQEQLKNKKKK
ncbi:MAG: membrane protein insertase YidC [Crocinitomicaceae bacterium]|nr:membrane protein insertase YidC [Crocinitomicaceae bacterium]